MKLFCRCKTFFSHLLLWLVICRYVYFSKKLWSLGWLKSLWFNPIFCPYWKFIKQSQSKLDWSHAVCGNYFLMNLRFPRDPIKWIIIIMQLKMWPLTSAELVFLKGAVRPAHKLLKQRNSEHMREGVGAGGKWSEQISILVPRAKFQSSQSNRLFKNPSQKSDFKTVNPIGYIYISFVKM